MSDQEYAQMIGGLSFLFGRPDLVSEGQRDDGAVIYTSFSTIYGFLKIMSEIEDYPYTIKDLKITFPSDNEIAVSLGTTGLIKSGSTILAAMANMVLSEKQNREMAALNLET